MFEIEGRVAVVTGSAHGLGKEIAKSFAQAGAAVAICDRNEGGALAAAAEISAAGRATGRFVDVTDSRSIDDLIKHANAVFGVAGIWVNNAAIDMIEPIADISGENWRSVLDVNLTGAFLASQAAAKDLVDAGKAGTTT